jgi:hypothetical protein
MPRRRADADTRRFFDEFEKVRVSRFRAMGVIDPAKREALIPFPNGKTKLIGVGHVRLKYGGGYSYFVCPKCAKLAGTLYLIDDAPRCIRCCDGMGIKYRTRMGFGRDERRRAKDRILDQLIAKLETKTPLKLKTPKSWEGRAQIVYNSRALAETMRRRMVELRLHQLASQHASENKSDTIRTYRPVEATRQLIDIAPIWRARSTETLEQALDAAQVTIIAALNSGDPQQRLNAAKLMLRTKQARDRGL